MTLASKAEEVATFSMFYAFVMFVLAIVSMIMTSSYLETGEVEAWASVGICMVGMFIFLVFMCATTIPAAIRVAQESGSEESQRALYIFLLLPVIFIAVMVSNSANYFLNVLIFGWPLFLISGVLMMLAANWLRIEANLLGFKVRCGQCGVSFNIDKDETYGICSVCGAPNWNPFKPEERKELERTMVAYTPKGPGDPIESQETTKRMTNDLMGYLTGFLLITSALSLVGGFTVLVETWGWDTEGVLAGLVFLVAGVIGFFAYGAMLYGRSYLAPLVASSILLILSIFLFIVFDVCGIIFGGFAVASWYYSYQLWMRTQRGRKVRVPVGRVPDEAYDVARHR